MNRLNYPVILILSLILFNCNENKVKTVLEKQPSIIDSIIVDYPDDYIGGLKFQSQYIGKNDFLIKTAEYNGEFYIYPLNITNRKYEKTIHLFQDGPDGYQMPAPNFYVHTLDSIFIFPSRAGEILLYDNSGKIVNRYPFKSDDNLSFGSLHAQQTGGIFKNNLLLNGISGNPQHSNFLSDNHTTYKYDFTKQNLDVVNSYPEYLHGMYLPQNFVCSQSLVVFDTLLLTNYPFAEELYFENIEDDEDQFRVKAGLEGFKHIEPKMKPASELQSMAAELEFPIYKTILYDKYRSKIYRLINHKAEEYSSLSGQEVLIEIANGNNRVWQLSMIQLNSQLTIEKVINLPLNKIWVPTKTGLLTEAWNGEDDSKDRFYILKLD